VLCFKQAILFRFVVHWLHDRPHYVNQLQCLRTRVSATFYDACRQPTVSTSFISIYVTTVTVRPGVVFISEGAGGNRGDYHHHPTINCEPSMARQGHQYGGRAGGESGWALCAAPRRSAVCRSAGGRWINAARYGSLYLRLLLRRIALANKGREARRGDGQGPATGTERSRWYTMLPQSVGAVFIRGTY